jgi:FecR protein
VVFRDDTRMVVQSRSRFVIDQYYFEPEIEQPSAIFRLVRGGLRALTGAIGKKNRRGFRVTTSVATIGIRGTGFDLYANEHCAEGAALTGNEAKEGEECTFVNVWDGAVEADGEPVESGQTGYVADADAEPVLLAETPGFIRDTDAPRPDQIDVNLDELFGAEPADSGDPGIYVSVYDGEAFVDTPQGPVGIAVGEAVHVDPETGDVTRLAGQPLFLLNDPYPLPSEFDDRVESAFEFFGDDIDGFNNRDSLECRIN